MRIPAAVLGIVTGIGAMLLADAANAIPAFARKYDMKCSNCHYAFPSLNATGRRFKEAGYRFDTEGVEDETLNVSDLLQLEKHVPVSVLFISQPYMKESNGQSHIQALHGVDLIGAGTLSRQWSGWFEIGIDDENDFSPELESGTVTYRHNDGLNFQMSYAPFFWSDPYGLLLGHFRMTDQLQAILASPFGGADNDGTLGDSRQEVTVYGRPMEKLFYSASVGGSAGDTEGQNPSNFAGRVAYDITDKVMVGAYGVSGEDGATNLEFSRWGLDFLADVEDFRFQGGFTVATDDQPAGGDQDNNAYSLAGMWVKRTDDGRPVWSPIIRWDRAETNDGHDNFNGVTLNFTYYVTQNVKVFAEVFDQYDAPTNDDEFTRFLVQVQAAF